MKKDIHPSDYRYVVFQDANAGEAWLSRSTVPTDKTIAWEDGKEYPLYQLSISRYSHPFFTGTERLVDAEGRVERFYKKYQKATKTKKKK